MIGPQAYKLLKSLVAPAKPGEKDYNQLVQALKQHYEPAPSEIVRRYRFNSRVRHKGESVATYVSELRGLAQFCNFGEALDTMLRDRLVCGINDESIQRSLLAEASLTLKKAVELAQGLEAAAKNSCEMQATSQVTGQHSEEVHAVSYKKTEFVCYRCGQSGHGPAHCTFRTAQCHKCGKIGHIKRMCQSKKTPRVATQTRSIKPTQNKNSQPVRAVQNETTEQTEEYPLHNVESPAATKPLLIEVMINDQLLSMEVDTGSAVTLVSEHTFKNKFPNTTLQPSSVKLRTYSNESLQVVGQIEAKVQYEKQEAKLPLIVVEGNGPSLFGRDWLAQIFLDWKKIHSLQKCVLKEVLDRHSHVFKENLGTLQGYEAHLYVDPQAKPRYCKARPVPYSMRTIVEQELDRLVSEGILEPVKFADWASPIVPVLKADGRSVRICGDFKLLNQACKLDKYPLPKIEDLFVKVAGGKAFTKLDLSQAYQQVPLAEESRKYVVINTHRGLFQYHRLPFGVSSAPGVFQRVMENLLKDIPGVVVYLDDILITGKTDNEHLATLEEVLQRLAAAGLHLKREKCTFLVPSVTYLGFKIDSQGYIQ